MTAITATTATTTATIVNLMPHAFNCHGVNVPPSRETARVSVKREKVGEFAGVPVYAPAFGEVEMVDFFGQKTGAKFPEQKDDGTIYIVSAMVKGHPSLVARAGVDVFSPGTPVRNAEGVIIGADGLDG